MYLIDREQAVELISKQMVSNPPNKVAWHYGRVELRELLDAIYGPWKEGDPEL